MQTPSYRLPAQTAVIVSTLLATAAPALAESDLPLDDRDTLTGDWGGQRSAMVESGVEIGVEYIGEMFGNVSGGVDEGSVYTGRAELAVGLDLETLLGWRGATIFANGYQIHGRSIASDYLGGNLLPPSNIDAGPSTRLFNLWLEQSLLDDRLAIRIGQIAADDEFLGSDTAGTFLNGTFGWAATTANNMTEGGSAYPLAAPGVLVRGNPTDSVTVLAAAFAGDPTGPNNRNEAGTTFSLAGGVLYLAEVKYETDMIGGLPGTYSIGAGIITAASTISASTIPASLRTLPPPPARLSPMTTTTASTR
ncbi:MAG: hypothetical protein CMM50_04090 [Rhodospirillaceae bacterium]|nr:hypothetical protein [Rhodospirillaceae bacterium]